MGRSETVPFLLRIPKPVYESVRLSAERSSKSINSYIVSTIARCSQFQQDLPQWGLGLIDSGGVYDLALANSVLQNMGFLKFHSTLLKLIPTAEDSKMRSALESAAQDMAHYIDSLRMKGSKMEQFQSFLEKILRPTLVRDSDRWMLDRTDSTLNFILYSPTMNLAYIQVVSGLIVQLAKQMSLDVKAKTSEGNVFTATFMG